MDMIVALAQINPIVGDFDGNRKKIISILKQCKGKADLVAFPELAICGYPPKDLLYQKDFIVANKKSLLEIIPHTTGIDASIGFVDSERARA